MPFSSGIACLVSLKLNGVDNWAQVEKSLYFISSSASFVLTFIALSQFEVDPSSAAIINVICKWFGISFLWRDAYN